MSPIQLEASWLTHLQDHLASEQMARLRAYLLKDKIEYQVFPPGPEMFAALNLTPLDKVKVVILGQDPYHGPNQAHGLSFSVRRGVRIPPSLGNIFRELHDDLGIARPAHGELTGWAEQGVLLLNTVLSVRAHQANSHRRQGWEQFTDRVISVVNSQRQSVVFLLWGAAAGRKATMIDETRHLILRSVHPSPLSAHRGFLGCRHFSQTNDYLVARGQEPIDWELPS
ncbi:MAG TPA: uracil-DNA glycosylase [Myxococcales bacterium]|nr:uracil-DNA glycosylase [Myxococcales bacterium]